MKPGRRASTGTPRPDWWKLLPRPLDGLRALDELAHVLTNYERSEPFHRGRVGLSLRATRRLLAQLRDPLRGIPVVHVAGSKGKGSVCMLLASLLQAQGVKTGVYLSPHVDAWNERIQVGGRPLAPRVMGRHVEQVLRAAARDAGAGRSAPTLFETLTAAAFLAFRAARVDVAIVEVGIGGRLDATNVVRSDVAIVTALEREHVKVLGRTLAEIAWQKAGIFKRGAAALSGIAAADPIAKLLRRAARTQGASPWVEWGRDVDVAPMDDAGRFELRRRGRPPLELPVPAGGPFAPRNAALAITALELLARRRPELRLSLEPARLAAGLRAARLPARSEVVGERPRVVRDGAHTPTSLRAVAQAAAAAAAPAGSPGPRPVVLFALKSDKPLGRCLAALKGACGPLVATVVPGGRSHAPAAIVAAARRLGITGRSMAIAVADPRRALAVARRRAGPNGFVLVTGSFWLAGIAGKMQRRRPARPR